MQKVWRGNRFRFFKQQTESYLDEVTSTKMLAGSESDQPVDWSKVRSEWISPTQGVFSTTDNAYIRKVVRNTGI